MTEPEVTPAALAEARQHLFDLLLSPWLRRSPWAISISCAYLDHPHRPGTKAQPHERLNPCVCGFKKGRETA